MESSFANLTVTEPPPVRRRGNPAVAEEQKTLVSEKAVTRTHDPDFDYIHFTTFLGLKNVTFFDHSDILPPETTSQEAATSESHGASMAVSTRWCKTGPLAGQLIAIKKARLHTLGPTARFGAGETVQQQVRRRHQYWLQDLYFELQIMTHRPLCEHPNIVRLLGVTFESETVSVGAGRGRVKDEESIESFRPVLVVEPAHAIYTDLKCFFEKSERGKRGLAFAEAAELMADIADGIAALHAYKVAHGDIKPANILIFPVLGHPEKVTAKICDFGASEIMGSVTEGQTISRVFTPVWAAPEVHHGTIQSVAEDVYAFGLVVAYIALAGTVQFVSFLVREEDGYGCERLLKEVNEYVVKTGWTQNEAGKVGWLLKGAVRVEPWERRKGLGSVRHELLGTQPRAPVKPETVVPFRKSIKSDTRESTVVDYRQANIYQALQAIYRKLPSHLQDRLIHQVYSTLENPPKPSTSTGETEESVKEKVYSATCAYYTLFDIEQNRNLPQIRRFGNQSNAAHRHELFRSLASQTNSFDRVASQLAPICGFDFPTNFPILNHHTLHPRNNPLYLDRNERVLLDLAHRSAQGYNALHAVAQTSRDGLVPLLIQRGVNVNQADSAGWTPLHVACLGCNFPMIEALLNAGAAVNPLAKHIGSVWTPLAIAIDHAQNVYKAENRRQPPNIVEILELLLDRGADPWIRDSGKLYGTVAHLMPINPVVLEVLFKHSLDLAKSLDSREQTPLHIAALLGGARPAIEVLLRYGADPSAATQLGTTVLHQIADIKIDYPRIGHVYWPQDGDVRNAAFQRKQFHGPPEKLQRNWDFLVQNGADLSARDRVIGLTPLEAGFMSLTHVVGPTRAMLIMSSQEFPFSIGMRESGSWIEGVYKLTPSLTLRMAQGEPAVLNLHILGAHPPDPAWGYYLLIDLAKLPNAEYEMEVTVTELDNKSTTPLLRHSFSSRSIPETNKRYTISAGFFHVLRAMDLHVRIRVFHPRSPTRAFGDLVLFSAKFELEHSFSFNNATTTGGVAYHRPPKDYPVTFCIEPMPPLAHPPPHSPYTPSPSTKRIYHPWQRTPLILARLDSKESEDALLATHDLLNPATATPLATALKTLGNTSYTTHRDYFRALDLYASALKILLRSSITGAITKPPPPPKLLFALHNNSAICANALGRREEAGRFAGRALGVKGLTEGQRGKAERQLEEAREALIG